MWLPLGIAFSRKTSAPILFMKTLGWFVEERFSILFGSDNSTSCGIDALYIIVFKSCLL